MIQALAARPYGFDFCQAMRLVECAYADRPRIGTTRRAVEDPIRLGQEASTAFAPSTLADVQLGPPGRAPRLVVRFLGLLGPNGPMPLHFTEYVRERDRHAHDRTLLHFLDVFHHRMLSLFYRAWSNAQPAVGRDRPGDDHFSLLVGSLIGINTEGGRDRDAVPDEAKMHYAGHLARRSRNAAGLRSILADFFQLPTRIDQWVGMWVALPVEYQLRLGESAETGALGVTSMVGERFWDCQQKFRVVFGPMSLADYERMLPGGPSYRRLYDWIRNDIGDQLAWDVQLVLKREEVPPSQLGAGTRLGWTSWLTTEPLERDADDLIIQPSAA